MGSEKVPQCDGHLGALWTGASSDQDPTELIIQTKRRKKGVVGRESSKNVLFSQSSQTKTDHSHKLL